MYNGTMQQSRRQGPVQAKVLTVAQALASYIRNPVEHSIESDMLWGCALAREGCCCSMAQFSFAFRTIDCTESYGAMVVWELNM